MKKVTTIAAALCLLLFAGTAHAAANKFVRIGTSSVGGGFFLIGNTLAQLAQQKIPGTTFSAITGGSVKNCINIEKGEIEIGLAHASTINSAWEGSGAFKSPLTKLTYIMALYPAPAHVMVYGKSGINSVADFKGKAIDLGPVGGGIEVTSKEIFSCYGLQGKDYTAERFGKAEFEEAFRSGRIQGHIWPSALPNAQIAELLRTGDVKLLPMEPDRVKAIVEQYPHYVATTIPKGTYEGYETDIQTIGSVASLVARDDVPEEIVYQFTKMIFENKDFLKQRLSSYLGYIDLGFAMAARNKTPLHPGAARYYKEQGILQ